MTTALLIMLILVIHLKALKINQFLRNYLSLTKAHKY
jgi:hypothetical protein